MDEEHCLTLSDLIASFCRLTFSCVLSTIRRVGKWSWRKMFGVPPTIVHFNVGGHHHSAAISTILAYENSYLARLIERDHEKELIRRGEEIFIDGNGEIFEYILDFLRYADSTSLPTDAIVLRKLRADAEFFELPDLKKLIDSETDAFKKSKVNLNVGCVPYATSISPILGNKKSKLYELIKAENDQRTSRDTNEIFIDRNGRVFKYVLEYLRNGEKMILPQDRDALREIFLEAEYFRLIDLQKLISAISVKWEIDDYVRFTALDLKQKFTWSQCPHVEGFRIYSDLIRDTNRMKPLSEWMGVVLATVGKCLIVKFTYYRLEDRKSFVLHAPEIVLKSA